jgi:hypothetical protein
MMAGTAQETAQPGRGRRAAAAAVAAVVLSVGGAIAAAQATSAPGKSTAGDSSQVTAGALSGSSATPSGWAPVPYQRAQLSVPQSWLVETPGQFSCGLSEPGMIFAGAEPRFPAGTGCHLTARLAWIRHAGHIPAGIRHQQPTAVIHGIPVYRLSSAPGSLVYLVPELRVRVGARGPLARRVLATLTRSPLTAVLRRGRGSPVPASWTRHRLGGVRFAVPASWTVQHEKQWATCGTGVVPRSLLLVDATRPPMAIPCPFAFPTADAQRAEPGLTVVTGKFAAQSVAEKFPSCQVRRGATVCLSTITGQGGTYSGVLIFSVSRPHQHSATYFLLGLPGSGARARAVFDSVRAVRT